MDILSLTILLVTNMNKFKEFILMTIACLAFLLITGIAKANDVIQGITLSVDGVVVETSQPYSDVIIDNTTDKVQVIYYGNIWGQIFDPKPVPFTDPSQPRCKATWHNAGTVCDVN